MPKRRYSFWVYILASRSRTLYIGVTNNLHTRVSKHREQTPGTHTAKYQITRLVYFEHFQYINNALTREKELKHWTRAQKIALVESTNPTWEELIPNPVEDTREAREKIRVQKVSKETSTQQCRLPAKASLRESGGSAFIMVLACSLLFSTPAKAQEFVLRALEDGTNKPLSGIPITLRYDCTAVGSGLDLRWKGCKWITRRTDRTGTARFPEAGSLPDIDDVYSLPIAYGMTCCDVQPKTFPSEATMRFRKRTLAEQLHWMFVGD